MGNILKLGKLYGLSPRKFPKACLLAKKKSDKLLIIPFSVRLETCFFCKKRGREKCAKAKAKHFVEMERNITWVQFLLSRVVRCFCSTLLLLLSFRLALVLSLSLLQIYNALRCVNHELKKWASESFTALLLH